jgi:hypothetical protein
MYISSLRILTCIIIEFRSQINGRQL